MYFKNRTIELRERCGPFLDRHGLKMKLEKQGGDYRLEFEGESMRSPVAIVFKGPGRKKHAEASWARGYLDIDCYDLYEFGGSGWKRWSLRGTTQYDFEGTDEEMLQQVLEYLEYCDLVPTKEGQPGFCDCEEFAQMAELAGRMFPGADFAVSRNDGVERLDFEAEGRNISIEFPLSDAGNQHATVRVGTNEPQRFWLDERKTMVKAIFKELDLPEPSNSSMSVLMVMDPEAWDMTR